MNILITEDQMMLYLMLNEETMDIELTNDEYFEAETILEKMFSDKSTSNFHLHPLNENILTEGMYKGRKVELGKIMRGDVKKFKVYVKNDKGTIVKVNFGQKGMRIKKNNPNRRKSFRARHKCQTPGPRWKPRYWACKTW